MGGKFEIHTEATTEQHEPIGRYEVVRLDRCISCGECTKSCIYDVHRRDPLDPRQMAEPESQLCRACLVCVQQCPRQALDVVLNPQLNLVGTPPFDADSVLTIWQEAAEGKIPVHGAGYGGPFRGEGFDGMWTDMSEIVRPTRDGIHGREYISTEVDIGRKLPHLANLSFDHEGRLLSHIPLTREIPIPMLFGRPPLSMNQLRLTSATVRAAMELRTFSIMDLDLANSLGKSSWNPDDPMDARAVRYLRENRNHAIVHLGDSDFGPDGALAYEPPHNHPWLPDTPLWQWASVVELDDGPQVLDRAQALREKNSDAIIFVQVPATHTSHKRVVELAAAGLDVIHLSCTWQGGWTDAKQGNHSVVQAIENSHRALVEAGLREQVSLLISGGISKAEHIPKAILLGADAVVLDVPHLVAVGCKVCGQCRTPQGVCTRNIDALDPKWAVRRMVNLMAAWRNQLLEILGAMGLRDVRRLRGEVGRGLFADSLEQQFNEKLTPLSKTETPLNVPGNLPAVKKIMMPSEKRMRWVFGHWRVERSDECVQCGLCSRTCSAGALLWPEGLRQQPPANHELCVGPMCADKCWEKCPSDAISIKPDKRLQVQPNHRWTQELIVETWNRARGSSLLAAGNITSRGESAGGFDRLQLVPAGPQLDPESVDLSLELNRRQYGPQIKLPFPIYGGGMSYGSIGIQVMLGRAKAAAHLGTLTCTGEGGFPEELSEYSDNVITQVATGYFGVREETIQRAPMVEFKYAQGAKPGLGGHLLGDKNTPTVAKLREAVAGTALFSPFPFHSVYSIEDHRKHIDWVRQINPDALVSVKVSTPGDVDMVAVGSYHAGANIVHIDGAYGGTGAAPDVAKKNIAMPIELALHKTHRFLQAEGIRDEIVLIASGGIRTPMDVIKAVALGADGVVIGTAELVAVSCVLCRNCEKDRGCPRGIATTDPELASLMDSDWVKARIVNMYRAWEQELRWILSRLGIGSIAALRGRSDVLRVCSEPEECG